MAFRLEKKSVNVLEKKLSVAPGSLVGRRLTVGGFLSDGPTLSAPGEIKLTPNLGAVKSVS